MLYSGLWIGDTPGYNYAKRYNCKTSITILRENYGWKSKNYFPSEIKSKDTAFPNRKLNVIRHFCIFVDIRFQYVRVMVQF